MPRYIGADKLIKFANNSKNKTIDANDIARFPTADVVEVVRCKDCKHHDEDYYTENGVCLIQFDCDGSRLIVTDNHYCSFGEKRDD